jgi:hypothetical protein
MINKKTPQKLYIYILNYYNIICGNSIKHIYLIKFICSIKLCEIFLHIFYVTVLYYVFTGKGEQISIAWYVIIRLLILIFLMILSKSFI